MVIVHCSIFSYSIKFIVQLLYDWFMALEPFIKSSHWNRSYRQWSIQVKTEAVRAAWQGEWWYHLLDLVGLQVMSIDPNYYPTRNVGNLSRVSVDRFCVNFFTHITHISNNEMSVNDGLRYWISRQISQSYYLMFHCHRITEAGNCTKYKIIMFV